MDQHDLKALETHLISEIIRLEHTVEPMNQELEDLHRRLGEVRAHFWR